MNEAKTIAAGACMLVLSTLSTSVSGETVSEMTSAAGDTNSVIDSAQVVDTSSGNLTITGELLFSATFDLTNPAAAFTFNKDVDFYSFFASAGDELVIDVDGGIGGALSIDTKIGLFGPASDYPVLAESEDASSVDEGSESLKDPRIDGFRVPADGVYTVVVTGRGALLADGGDAMGGAPGALGGNGDYLLKISGTSTAATSVDIAITKKMMKKHRRKGKREKTARINLKKKRHIKVAILGSESFPVSNIDSSSLTFGAVGTEDTLRKCKHRTKDVNRDGQPDLVCEFSLRDSGFNKYSYEGILNGQTSDGQHFSGADKVVVKGKRKSKG